MKKKMNVLWRLGLCLAVLAGMLIVLGCPTDGETSGNDRPTVATAPGFYAGSSVDPVDLTVAVDAGAKDIITQAFYWLRTGAEENGVYTIILGDDISAELNVPNDGSFNVDSEGQGTQPGWIMYNRHTVNQALKTTVIIKSAGSAKTIKLKNKGHLIHMGAVSAVTMPGWPPDVYLPGYDETLGMSHKLVLENVILQGLSTAEGDPEDNNAALLYVGQDAVLEIKDGAKITGNAHVEALSNKQVRGGGILMNKSARVVLDGGSIENNKAENTAASPDSSTNSQAWGGGVSLSDAGDAAAFILKRGTIKDNKSIATGTARGGGINNQTGSVYIYGGSITGNIVQGGPGIFSGYGGAIGYQFYYRGLYIYGGEISGNQAFAGIEARAIPGVFINTRGGSNNDRALVLEGSPKIPDGVCFSGTDTADNAAPLQVIWIGKDMQGIKYDTNTDQIPLDFISAPANGAPLLRWTNSGTGALPVGKFVIRNLISADGTTGAALGGSISADGKYVAP